MNVLKSVVICSALSVSSMLGGCVTTGPNGSLSQADISNLVAQAQTDAQIACGIIPVATDLAILIEGAIPAAGIAIVPTQLASQVANQVCGAVVAKQAQLAAQQKRAGFRHFVRRKSVMTVVVNGVPIRVVNP